MNSPSVLHRDDYMEVDHFWWEVKAIKAEYQNNKEGTDACVTSHNGENQTH